MKQECDDFKSALEEKFNSGAFVTETFRSEDGKSWYRIWSDGWIEQGGAIASLVQDTYTAATITLLTPFANTNYNVQITQYNNNRQLGGGPNNAEQSVFSKETGSFVVSAWSWTYGIDWYACGY